MSYKLNFYFKKRKSDPFICFLCPGAIFWRREHNSVDFGFQILSELGTRYVNISSVNVYLIKLLYVISPLSGKGLG